MTAASAGREGALDLGAPGRADQHLRDVALRRRLTGLGFLVASLVVVTLLSLSVGSNAIPLATVVDALFDFDDAAFEQIVVRELRLPRTYLGLLVGAALGASGALMQAVTRNPLAGPGILGVNAGAAFMVVIALWWLGTSGTLVLAWFAFAGAAFTSIAVYLLGTTGRAGATPVRLALAGAAVTALLGAWTGAIMLRNPGARLIQFRYWAVGSLTGGERGDEVVLAQVVPVVVVGVLIAVALARQLNAMALGDDTAQAMGVRLNVTRSLSVLAVTLLCGSAVAVAGPIGFVGLVVPHVMRFWFGPDQRWLIPTSAVAGATFLLACDIAGRVAARPGEVEVGITTAVIGGPSFIFLVRRTRMAQL